MRRFEYHRPATVDEVCDDQPFAALASSHWTRSGHTEFAFTP